MRHDRREEQQGGKGQRGKREGQDRPASGGCGKADSPVMAESGPAIGSVISIRIDFSTSVG